MPDLATPIAIAIAGGIGAAARFVLDGVITSRNRASVPIGTLVINVVGSFLLGLVAGWAAEHGASSLTVLLGIGLLGGFTTFSTASVELVALVRDDRPHAAAALAAGMLLLALAAAVLGVSAAGVLFG